MRKYLSVTLVPVILGALGLLALSAGPAMAVPPAVDQYTEQVETPGGPKKIDDEVGDRKSGTDRSDDSSRGNGSQAGTSSGLPAGESTTSSSGQENGTSGRKAGEPGDSSSASREQDGQDGSSPAIRSSSVAAGSSKDLGWLFPLLLIGATAGAGGYVLYRRRNRSAPNS